MGAVHQFPKCVYIISYKCLLVQASMSCNSSRHHASYSCSLYMLQNCSNKFCSSNMLEIYGWQTEVMQTLLTDILLIMSQTTVNLLKVDFQALPTKHQLPSHASKWL